MGLFDKTKQQATSAARSKPEMKPNPNSIKSKANAAVDKMDSKDAARVRDNSLTLKK